MDWNRGGGQQPNQPLNQAAGAAPAAVRKQRGGLTFLKGLRIAQVSLLFSVTILIVAAVWLLALGGGKAENSYVDDKKLQAVFLNGGQVYFGNIKDLNGKFLSMSNIYYLRVNQQVQPNQSNNSSNDISLVKLGCELHGPQDSMVINREQVIFWENLKDDGQVAKAVAEYVKQNPNGQKCETSTTSNNNDTSNTTTNNTSTNNSTNNTSNTTTNTNTNKPTTTR